MAQREKLFVGPRLRRLRQSLDLTQARMAEELGISTSYLNLIEGNQRPVSANLLLALAETYDVDVAAFSGTGDLRLITDLNDAVRDPMVSGADAMPIPKTELEAAVAACPALAERFLALYQNARQRPASGAVSYSNREQVELFDEVDAPVETVRDFLHGANNHFPTLDVAAERLALSLASEGEHFRPERLYGALRRRLLNEHQLAVRIMPVEIMGEMLRTFDRHRRRIDLSELMTPQARCFQLGYQLALLEQRENIDEILAESDLRDEEALRLARVTLANYFAAAIMMPYNLFLRAAQANKYDLELLGHRFNASFEQVAHRLTTLQRAGTKGIPFFFIRIDIAGNVSKRLSAGRFHFSRFGGTCPLWNIHECFQTPGKIFTQIIQLPGERPWFSIARTVERAGGSFSKPAQMLAVALGCDLRYASQLVYAEPFQLEAPNPVPIGINCYLCDRTDCDQRAYAPINRKTHYDERRRSRALVHFSEEA